MRIVSFGDDAAGQGRCCMARELDDSRFERHQRDRSCVACEHVNSAIGQPRVAVKAAFDLQQQCGLSCHKIAQLTEVVDALGAALEANRLDLCGTHFGVKTVYFGKSYE